MGILKAIIPKNTWQTIKAYVDNALSVNGLPSQSGNEDKFLTTNGTNPSWTHRFIDITNTATGDDTVTVNGLSGRAVFTDVLIANGFVTFTINNTFASGYSSVLLLTTYDTFNQGNPLVVFSKINGTAITFDIYNLSDFNSNGNIKIDFLLMG